MYIANGAYDTVGAALSGSSGIHMRTREGFLGWHLVGSTLSHTGEPTPKDNVWFELPDGLGIAVCHRGLHGCLLPHQTVNYAPVNPKWLCLVEIAGDLKFRSDKLAGKYRRILRRIDVEHFMYIGRMLAVRQMLLEDKWAESHKNTGPDAYTDWRFLDPLMTGDMRELRRLARPYGRYFILPRPQGGHFLLPLGVRDLLVADATKRYARAVAWAVGYQRKHASVEFNRMVYEAMELTRLVTLNDYLDEAL